MAALPQILAVAIPLLGDLEVDCLSDGVSSRYPFVANEDDVNKLLQMFADWLLYELPSSECVLYPVVHRLPLWPCFIHSQCSSSTTQAPRCHPARAVTARRSACGCESRQRQADPSVTGGIQAVHCAFLCHRAVLRCGLRSAGLDWLLRVPTPGEACRGTAGVGRVLTLRPGWFVQTVTFCGDWLKRLKGADPNDRRLVDTLFRFVIGNTTAGGILPATRSAVECPPHHPFSCADPADKRKPGCNKLRVAVARYLLQSETAVNSFPTVVKVLFETWFGADTTHQLQQAGLEVRNR